MRHPERDRLRVDFDCQVNLKAKTEITAPARGLVRLETALLGKRDEPEGPPRRRGTERQPVSKRARRRRLPRYPGKAMVRHWSREEVEATVADYFNMLAQELAGVPFKKSSHRESLLKRLDSRSDAAVEYKHENISQVLLECGYPFIDGYKPASSYQALLGEEVARFLFANPQVLDLLRRHAEAPVVDLSTAEGEALLELEESPPPARPLPALIREKQARPRLPRRCGMM